MVVEYSDVGDKGKGELGAKSNSLRIPLKEAVLFADGRRNGDLAGTDGGIDDPPALLLLKLLVVEA